MSRFGLLSLGVWCWVLSLGAGSVVLAQADGGLEALAARTARPQLVRRAAGLVTRPADLAQGLRVATSVAAEEPSGPVVAAALLQPAQAAGRLDTATARAALGAEVSRLLSELACPLRGSAEERQALLDAHYLRLRAASHDAHLIELHAQLDAAHHLQGLDLPVRLGVLRQTRERVVPALRPRSPDLAQRLAQGLTELEEQVQAELEQEVHGRLAPYRRADGTLQWDEVLKQDLLQRSGERAHFTLGLFLQELAVVVQVGSRERIEEFFDGLSRTDFFLQYGFFSLGANEVRYHRYLEQFVKPRFVHELLRTNVVVASGVALPEIAAGSFSGRSFGVNLSALGLSSPATSVALNALHWLERATKVRSVRVLTHMSHLAKLSKLGAEVGGWIYTIGEVAVVLYLTEQLEPRIRANLEREAARDELCDATLRFYSGLGRGERVEPLAADFHAAWTRYRDFLYAPMLAEEHALNRRLEGLARKLKLISDQRCALLDQLPSFPALEAHALARGGSTQGYVDGWLLDTRTFQAQQEVDLVLARYVSARRRHLTEVYARNRRRSDYLAGVDYPSWHALGAVSGVGEDPFTDGMFAERRRESSRRAFRDALEDLSENRLQTYEDERAALTLALQALAAREGASDALAELGSLYALVQRTEELDYELASVVTGGLVSRLPAAEGSAR